MIERMLRKLLVAIFGAPLCRGCVLHGTYCVGFCDLTDRERIERFVERGEWPEPKPRPRVILPGGRWGG